MNKEDAQGMMERLRKHREERCALGRSNRDSAVARAQVEKVEMRMAQVGCCKCYQTGGTER